MRAKQVRKQNKRQTNRKWRAVPGWENGKQNKKKRIRSAKTTKVALVRQALLCSGDMCVCACIGKTACGMDERHMCWWVHAFRCDLGQPLSFFVFLKAVGKWRKREKEGEAGEMKKKGDELQDSSATAAVRTFSRTRTHCIHMRAQRNVWGWQAAKGIKVGGITLIVVSSPQRIGQLMKSETTHQRSCVIISGSKSTPLYATYPCAPPCCAYAQSPPLEEPWRSQSPHQRRRLHSFCPCYY